MNFGRIPYQFTTINPSSEQELLRKRFGLANQDKMILDYGLRNGAAENNSVDCSPRLQHRVPAFGKDPNMAVDKCESNVEHSRKPNVRIVPIEIEGSPKLGRQRTFSGPAGTCDKTVHCEDSVIPGKHHTETETVPCRKRIPNESSTPKVINIPVKVVKSNDKTVPASESKSNRSIRDVRTMCNIPVSEEKPNRNNDPEFTRSLKKISDVMEELKSYEGRVENYNGSGNDKEYRYLDEMLTRCMLRLDDVETMGNEEIRSARKNAIKKVQSCIDFLETKINTEKDPKLSTGVENSEIMHTNHIDESLKCEEINEKEESPEIEMEEEPEVDVDNPKLKIDSNEENVLLIDGDDINRKDDSNEIEMKDGKSEVEMKDKECSKIEMKNPEIETKEESHEFKVETPEIKIKESPEIDMKEEIPEIEMEEECVSDLNCPTNKDTDEENILITDPNTEILPTLANCEETVNEDHSVLPNLAQDIAPSDANNSICNHEIHKASNSPFDNSDITLPNNSQDDDSAIKDERTVNATEVLSTTHAIDEYNKLKESSCVKNDSFLSVEIQNSEIEQSDIKTCSTKNEHFSGNVNISTTENR